MSQTYDFDWLVSIDDHVLEPTNLWQRWLPAKYKADGPRVIQDGEEEYWLYDGVKSPSNGLSCVAGRDREDFSPEPVTYAEMRPGCYDSKARLEDMDRAGILASMCYPSFPRFCGQVFSESDDKELGFACIQAYNNWMIEEWCGSAPGRFIPLIIIPFWDPALAATEIRRCAEQGVHAVSFSENPTKLGYPSIHDRGRYWDPMFQACDEAEVVIGMHQGSSSFRMETAPDAPALITMAWGRGSIMSGCLLDWLWSPVFPRFPNLKIALAEGGIGWIPYFLERSDQILDKQRFWAAKGDLHTNQQTGELTNIGEMQIDPLTLDTRALFHDHVYGCFIEDEAGLKLIDEIGADNIMIETDYPHSDTTWPNSIEYALRQLEGLDDEIKYKILRGNAERLFHFTPAVPTFSRA